MIRSKSKELKIKGVLKVNQKRILARSQSHREGLLMNLPQSPRSPEKPNKGYFSSRSRHRNKRQKKKERQKFVRDQKNRMKFENMINGRFIFDELYERNQETNFTPAKKEQDYQ